LPLKSPSAADFIPDYMKQLKQNETIVKRLVEITQNFLVDLGKVYTSIENTAIKLCLNKVGDSEPIEYAISCLYIASCIACRKYFGEIVISKDEFMDILGGSLSSFHENCRKIFLNLPKFL